MTTVPEFEAILTQMYQRGYVLVGIHDLAEVSEDETGMEQMRAKKILLPPGKKAFVMSRMMSITMIHGGVWAARVKYFWMIVGNQFANTWIRMELSGLGNMT